MFGDDPNAETVINDKGGKQSKIPVRMDLIPAREILELGKILAEGGKKYGDWNWLKIDINDHLNHALHHIYAYLDAPDGYNGTISEDEATRRYTELTHALCRLLFAATTHRIQQHKLVSEAKARV